MQHGVLSSPVPCFPYISAIIIFKESEFWWLAMGHLVHKYLVSAQRAGLLSQAQKAMPG
ncbi:predicted protein [Chaetomium globosum CBS 148.51]|uniref:Uncharacterized protein n=1 Tax=Chaetomium globosum (strain ATCC 6205 / CBS 148.51 / DSM 1962 / NBRC 6347 / NRRL 1970) TaxID=306901 RepID=Q2HHS9_CHAGB|nr:uncharacterized protein CHGG_00225 [Chaetomium globosum CBS 148.51]EAQ91990.1 predicted protein [Chaetomium globosum CBS 148.51]